MNPFSAFGDVRTSYCLNVNEYAEMARRKRLQDAALNGNAAARRILATDYHLIRWERHGQAVIEGAR